MDRYARQIPLIGEEGQKKLSESKVIIVGMGALGSVASELLTRAGVGNLLLIDREIVEKSNLQRQTLFTEEDIGKSKAETAKIKLNKINSDCKIKTEIVHLDFENKDLLKNADLILDCTDNLETRFFINDYCKKEKKKWIYAAAIKTKGFVMPIFPDGPCLQCFLKEASLETCSSVGVLNTITCSIAALQATLALKVLLDKKVDHLLYQSDLWTQEFRKLKVKKRENCSACRGEYKYLKNKNNFLKYCDSKYQFKGYQKNFDEIKQKWKVIDYGSFLKFKGITLFKDGRTLIKAKNKKEANSIYSKYVGN